MVTHCPSPRPAPHLTKRSPLSLELPIWKRKPRVDIQFPQQYGSLLWSTHLSHPMGTARKSGGLDHWESNREKEKACNNQHSERGR